MPNLSQYPFRSLQLLILCQIVNITDTCLKYANNVNHLLGTQLALSGEVMSLLKTPMNLLGTLMALLGTMMTLLGTAPS